MTKMRTTKKTRRHLYHSACAYAQQTTNKTPQVNHMRIPKKGEKIPISKFHLSYVKSIDISEAAVAYFDILGFSNKKDAEDIEDTLLDFYGPLAVSAAKNEKIRFNVFSDCAFLATSIDNAVDLLSAIRLCFREWIADGILVRGGIALGGYREIYGVAHNVTLPNLIGNSFSGSAVVEAVKLEGSGTGALLFCNKECAKFYQEKHAERIFTVGDRMIIGWSTDSSVLYWFVGISLLRLLKFLSLKNKTKRPAVEYLINNIKYSVAENKSLRFLVLAILCLPSLGAESHEKTLNLLGIREPYDFAEVPEPIKEWLNTKEGKKSMKMLTFLANSDTSIPQP